MKLEKIPLAETRSFNSFFLDYIEKKEELKPFYNRYPDIEGFKYQIDEKQKSFPPKNRETLVATLLEQYKNIQLTDPVKKNIDALSDSKTFTVTTGHQLNIFTGPLYFIYKIVTVINACKKLKAKYPEYNFVPVYWMASEDHDYAEIKWFRLYNKKYTWETEQAGAVGRFHTKDFSKLLPDVPGDVSIFKEAYTKNKKLSDAVRHYVNALFNHKGLVVIDSDSRSLKSLFKEVVRQDLFDGIPKKLVEKTNGALEALGHKPQVFCRDINFFYLDGSIRNRIETSGERFRVIDTELSFSKLETEKLIEEAPEKFSPNVILRPLYQEVILPNLAYVGGPAEMIYWLQLKSVFDHFKVPFPILLPRNFAMIMDHTVARKFDKTSLELRDLFEDKNYLFNHWVLKNSPRNLTVGAERTGISEIFEELKKRSDAIDKTLTAYVGAEGKRALYSLEKIEQKLLRAEKRLHADKLRQIENIKDALFPGGSLQERVDNFLNFYQQDSGFIQHLLDNFDPFDYQFNILFYQNEKS
jgi:bacillithiol biosynthesis cysteine-adding enzyme BshC